MNTVRNAKITSTMLGQEEHCIMTAYLMLDYGETSQPFGGFALDRYDKTRNCRVAHVAAGAFVMGVLSALKIKRWEDLPGKVCRVKIVDEKAYAVGHFIEDSWFCPREALQEISERSEAHE